MMARMLFCQFCQGHSSARPCFDYCLTTISKCLSQSIELQEEWTNYLRELLRLADRLSDPFNIESVVGLLDDKISEAIMNYQENSINVTTLVRQNCGHPPSKTRERRQLRPDDSTQTPSDSIPSSSSSRSSSSSGPSSSFPTSFSPFSTSSSSSSSSSSYELSSSFSSSSPSSSDSSSSSPSPTTRGKSGQRQQQRKQQRQRQQEEQQQREGQPEQREGQEEQTQRTPEQQEEQQRQRQDEDPPRRQHQQPQQREEQPSQSKQQKEQRRQQRQRERLEEEQRRQQQEELARQQQLYDEQQRQPLLHQPQESDQYTEQPPIERQRQQRQPLLSQPRESDQYIEQPSVEQQQQRQRLQQRQPPDSQQNRKQREPGQPKQRQQAKQQQRQQRPSSSEENLTELEQHLKDVSRKLEAVRTFWATLPLSICGDVIAEPSNETSCWNGVDLSRREGVASDSGYTRHRVQLSSVIRQLILKLKVASDKLRQAYNGWSENDLDGSGNGMDFGSGTEVETAPPFIEEIRTNPPEVAKSTESRATKTFRQLASGSCRPNSDVILVPILLSLFLISFHWFCGFFDTLCR